MVDSVNSKVGDIATQVGQTPQGWNSGIFNMIQNLSNNVVLPIAGVILALVMTMEFIHIIMDKNNMEDDYGMIDGIINNGPKEQPENKAKASDLTALFEEARRTVQEDRSSRDDGRKQSVLARLHEPTPPRNDKTAPIKSAERDLI